MKYVFSEWKKIIEQVTRKKIFVFLDYDGTLAPIASRPEQAVMSSDVRNALSDLAKKFKTAVISGRSIKDIKELINIKNMDYSGNHGFEISINNRIITAPSARLILPELAEVKKSLVCDVKRVRNAFVEDKGFILAVHWRLVDKKSIPELREIVCRHIKNKKKLCFSSGKKVWEIRPCMKYNKGTAIDFLLSRYRARKNCAVFYIGDDNTDEDAFEYLLNEYTIRVGRKNKSKAKYYVRNQDEVVRLLRLIEHL